MSKDKKRKKGQGGGQTDGRPKKMPRKAFEKQLKALVGKMKAAEDGDVDCSTQ